MYNAMINMRENVVVVIILSIVVFQLIPINIHHPPEKTAV